MSGSFILETQELTRGQIVFKGRHITALPPTEWRNSDPSAHFR